MIYSLHSFFYKKDLNDSSLFEKYNFGSLKISYM